LPEAHSDTFPTGAWAIHFVLIALLKIIFDIVPNISQETSWTLTNISYMAGSFLMFHWVRGVPFEFNAGAYDNLNMWEQIDSGDQYTPAKKFLLSVPIILFLVSTHYTHYDITYFMINFMATLAVVVPKLQLPSSDQPHSFTVCASLFSTPMWRTDDPKTFALFFFSPQSSPNPAPHSLTKDTK
jgi:hypothetical protein